MSFKKSRPIWIIQYRWRADAEWVPLLDCDVVRVYKCKIEAQPHLCWIRKTYGRGNVRVVPYIEKTA